MDKIKQLEYKLNQRKNEYGLVGAKPAKVQEYDDADYNISAHINPYDWGIEVNLKTGYNPIQDKRQKKYAQVKKIKDGLETVVLQVGSGHEVAHWELPFGSGKGCPMDVYNHDKIVEAIGKGLKEKGKNPDILIGNKQKQTLKSYIANMFEDTIINPRVKEYFGDFSGQILFWDNEGLRAEKQNGQKGFTPLYEAFVKTNLHLFGDKWDKAFLKRHYTNNKKVEEVVKEIIENCDFPENISDTTPLFDKSTWMNRAENYARAIHPLLEERMPQERLSAYSSGQGQSAEQDRGGNKPKSGNGIEEKAKTKDGKEEIAYGRYKSGEGQSPNIESFEQLDALYQRLAKDIPVKVESISREDSMEISPLNYRSFDLEKDNPLKIKTSKFFFNEDGFNFAYPNQPLTIDYKQKVQRKSFPNFKMVLVDNSGSMKDGIDGNSGKTNFIPFGDNSKYHYALLGYYGIENFLQNQGIAPYINHGVSLFSSSTRFKKGTYNDLVDIRKLLLQPNWGSTNLDAGILKKALEGEQSFFLSISDGEVSNWDSEKDEIKKLMESNYYTHIQLGSGTDMTEDLESWRMPVSYVNSGNDLTKLMIDITKDVYHPFVQEAKK
jgi:hypothetical protein